MKNIGIITIYGNKNFGNKLQNYALQTFLMSNFKNLNVYTIKSINPSLVNRLKRIIKYIFNFDSRENSFLRFNKYINYDKKIINYNNPIFRRKYDYLIYGSDQIWNTNFEGKYKLFSADFDYDAIFLSYSASFGTYELSSKFIDIYSKSLKKFKGISVRENQGKKILNKIGFNTSNVSVLIDPTMLLTIDEWSRIEKAPKVPIPDRYILNYFLGDLGLDINNEIKRIAKENNCEIISVLDKNSPYYACGPSEFLYLEKNAFLICTDSFHSAVFSLLYDKPFIIFDRNQKGIENMNSRIETLLSKFKLQDRKYNNKSIIKKNLDHNYQNAYKILQVEREKAKEFLKNIICKDSTDC